MQHFIVYLVASPNVFHSLYLSDYVSNNLTASSTWSVNMELQPWLSVEGIADYLGVSKETIYRWLERKKIPAHRIGKLWKFKPSEVDIWVMSGGAKNNEQQEKAN